MMESQIRWNKGSMPWERTPNKLLAKSQLGRTRPITIDVPDDRHYYGKEIPHDHYKAKEVIYDWQTHNPSLSNDPPSKDMIRSNKSCVANGLHTSGDFYKFRQTNSSIIPRKMLGSKQIKIQLPQENFVYGKQYQPSDAIRTIIGNGFGLYESQRLQRVYNTKNMYRSNFPRKLSAHMTKSYHLMKDSAQKKLQTLNWKRFPFKDFKLSKFQNVSHKVDHTRNRPKTSAGISSTIKSSVNQQKQQYEEIAQKNR